MEAVNLSTFLTATRFREVRSLSMGKEIGRPVRERVRGEGKAFLLGVQIRRGRYNLLPVKLRLRGGMCLPPSPGRRRRVRESEGGREQREREREKERRKERKSDGWIDRWAHTHTRLRRVLLPPPRPSPGDAAHGAGLGRAAPWGGHRLAPGVLKGANLRGKFFGVLGSL